MKKNHPLRKQLLTDHEKRGKKLVPPLVAGVGPFSYVPWINHIIPEIIWIALLHDSLGEVDGTTTALQLARVSGKYATQKPLPLFAGLSDYRILRENEQVKVVAELQKNGHASDLLRALSSLMHLYPTCPLRFLYSEPPKNEAACGLIAIKRVLRDLFDKELRRSVMAQATVVYIAFVLGRLKVSAGLTLSHFHEIEKYPTTELSRRVASATRCAAFGFFGESSATATWPIEFWNQGQQLEPCTFE